MADLEAGGGGPSPATTASSTTATRYANSASPYSVESPGAGSGGAGGASSNSRRVNAADSTTSGTGVVTKQATFPRVGEPRQPCTKVGNAFNLCGCGLVHYFPARFLVGPDWPCLMCTYALIVVPNLLCEFVVLRTLGTSVFIAGWCVMAVTLFALSATACSDPGIVNRKPPTDDAAPQGNYCRVCNIIRRPGTLHCQDCDCCVEELDHHCPWMGKCVGKYNLKFFYTFLTTMCINLAWVIVTVAVFLIRMLK